MVKAPAKMKGVYIGDESMVRAVLDGTKRQFRQIVKPQPRCRAMQDIGGGRFAPEETRRGLYVWDERRVIRSPHKPGDVLYCRETFHLGAELDDYQPSEVEPQYHGLDCPVVWYAADGYCGAGWGRKRSPLHLPRWAARLFIRIEGVRVERVAAINTTDCKLEGITIPPSDCFRDVNTGSKQRKLFERRWDTLHGPGAWEANPFVWAYTFTRAVAPATGGPR